MRIILLITLVLMQFTFTGAVWAEEYVSKASEQYKELKTNLATSLRDLPLRDCRATLTQIYDIETLEFFEFLEANFENKSSNSSLINIAIARYRDYKHTVYAYLDMLSPSSTAVSGSNLLSESEGYLLCRKLADSYVQLTKEQMINHIKSTNYQKKTTILTEKYHAINDELRSLNLVFAQLYAHFMTFKNKLPGFLQKCITG